jgi:hypothetical protein
MYARDGTEKAIDFDCFHGLSIVPDMHIAKADMLEAKNVGAEVSSKQLGRDCNNWQC